MVVFCPHKCHSALASDICGDNTGKILDEIVPIFHQSSRPGSVTPLGLLNDKESLLSDGNKQGPRVEFWLDANAAQAERLEFHPNACNATVVMRTTDFLEFLEKKTGHKVNVL